MLLLFFVIAAVALFIYSGFQNEQYEYLDREEPVSYTHLDVYKRQLL